MSNGINPRLLHNPFFETLSAVAPPSPKFTLEMATPSIDPFVRWEEYSPAPLADPTFFDYSLLFDGELGHLVDYTSRIQDQASLLSPVDNVGCPPGGGRGDTGGGVALCIPSSLPTEESRATALRTRKQSPPAVALNLGTMYHTLNGPSTSLLPHSSLSNESSVPPGSTLESHPDNDSPGREIRSSISLEDPSESSCAPTVSKGKAKHGSKNGNTILGSCQYPPKKVGSSREFDVLRHLETVHKKPGASLPKKNPGKSESEIRTPEMGGSRDRSSFRRVFKALEGVVKECYPSLTVFPLKLQLTESSGCLKQTIARKTVVRARASQFCSEGKGFDFEGLLGGAFLSIGFYEDEGESFPDVKNAIMVITTTSRTAVDTSMPMEIDPRGDTNGNEKLGSEDTMDIQFEEEAPTRRVTPEAALHYVGIQRKGAIYLGWETGRKRVKDVSEFQHDLNVPESDWQVPRRDLPPTRSREDRPVKPLPRRILPA
ncbi:hypothetical protein DFH08DRAFT_798277 [Mycena albidolilacea]|uniref:Uncharacterized protein n=1 Tax=Mycena albidolilacea TaxID=1033008 RepID=A0AAD7F1P6_9AGAR|nr:hypothetical protein DFH08DRAFT_798277 [Mycena albidolilacea]